MSIKVLSRSARKEARAGAEQGCLLKMVGRSARRECSRPTERQWSDSEFNINSWWASGSFNPQMAALLLQHFSSLSTFFLFCLPSSPAGCLCNCPSDCTEYCAARSSQRVLDRCLSLHRPSTHDVLFNQLSCYNEICIGSEWLRFQDCYFVLLTEVFLHVEKWWKVSRDDQQGGQELPHSYDWYKSIMVQNLKGPTVFQINLNVTLAL